MGILRLSGTNRNTLKQHFRALVERGRLKQQAKCVMSRRAQFRFKRNLTLNVCAQQHAERSRDAHTRGGDPHHAGAGST